MFYTKNQCFYNLKRSVYPNGYTKIVICNQKIFNDGFVLAEDVPAEDVPAEDVPVCDTADFDVIDSDIIENNKSHSVRRARQKIFDLAMLNGFTHFITLTFDKEKIDRYDDDVVYNYIQKYLNNCVNRKNLKYIIVPERHKDGALHFHGLISGNFKFIDSGLKDKNGNVIYNIADWKKGFSTAVKIGGNPSAYGDFSFTDYHKVCNYITKYISKNSDIIRGRYYLSGGHLVRDVPTFYDNVDFDDYILKSYDTGYGTSFKYFDFFDDNFLEKK